MVSTLSVLLAANGSPEELETTRRSLARDTDLPLEVAVVRDVEALARAVADGDTAFIAIVRAGTIVFPGALGALHTELASAPHIAMVDAPALPTDSAWHVSREDARAHARAARGLAAGLRAQRELPQPLSIFRREALRDPEGLQGASVDAAMRHATRRLWDRHAARRFPAILCARPSRRADVERRRTSLGGRLGTAFHRFRSTPLWGPIRRWPKPYDVASALAGLAIGRTRRVTRAHSNDSIRIAYVLWRYPTRSETFIRRELQALRGAGISIEVLALEPDSPPLPPDPASPAGDVTYFGPVDRSAGKAALLKTLRTRPWTVLQAGLGFAAHRREGRMKTWSGDWDDLLLAAQLASTLARHAITHVHAPWANHYALVASAAARMVGATFTVQARASEIHRVAESSAVADRVRDAQFVITNSRYNERVLHEMLAPQERPPIHVVRNGVDLERFDGPMDGQRLPGPFRLVAVGRLVEPKGFRHLLEVCARLRDSGRSFHCDIIGAATDHGDTVTALELQMLMSELALESLVCFHGPQSLSRVLDAYRRADLFVLPCVRARDGSHDITPNSLIEAMAMGLPVVSTTTGAIPEIVDHEGSGLLVPPGDVDALEAAVVRLMSDPTLRQALGREARRTVEERLDITENVKARIDLFATLAR